MVNIKVYENIVKKYNLLKTDKARLEFIKSHKCFVMLVLKKGCTFPQIIYPENIDKEIYLFDKLGLMKQLKKPLPQTKETLLDLEKEGIRAEFL